MSKRYKVLITGSSGMLGIDLSRELKKDYEVFGTDLLEKMRPVTGHFIKCDIQDRGAFRALVSRLKPQVLVHTAAWTNVDGCELSGQKAYEVNSIGTENVALATRDAGATLIYISTDFVFHGNKKKPYAEGDRPNPVNIYGKSKLRGEDFIKNTLREYYILRTSWLYGANGVNFVDQILSRSRTGDVLKVVNDQTGSPTYTKDLACAIHIVLDRMDPGQGKKAMPYGIYHVSNSGCVSWYEYACEVLRLAHSKTKVVPISSKDLGRPAKRPVMSVLDNTKFARATGHKMRSWKSALKEYIQN